MHKKEQAAHFMRMPVTY